ncbi:hypothetical protein N431DRAFT_429842, partial [Stipitochalara longipes BDJ]
MTRMLRVACPPHFLSSVENEKQSFPIRYSSYSALDVSTENVDKLSGVMGVDTDLEKERTELAMRAMGVTTTDLCLVVLLSAVDLLGFFFALVGCIRRYRGKV